MSLSDVRPCGERSACPDAIGGLRRNYEGKKGSGIPHYIIRRGRISTNEDACIEDATAMGNEGIPDWPSRIRPK